MSKIMYFSPEQEQFLQLAQTRAYHEGMRKGLSLYAHWKGGTQYVGTTGRTLKQAIDAINQEETDILEKYRKMALI